MRKIIQISNDGREPIALCDDGTVWKLEFCPNEEVNEKWTRLPDIPQTDD